MDAETKKEMESQVLTVNDFIDASLLGTPQELYRASRHYIQSGGKRLRPIMTIVSCEMFGGTKEDALPAASAVEFIHNFSLVHDDIMDNDDFRHGISTVHKIFGLPLAILSGDILFSKAFQILSHNTNDLLKKDSLVDMLRRLSTACIEICEGQAQDMYLTKLESFPMEDEYLKMISKKTAALFEVSCSLGALSSRNVSDKDVHNLALFGRNSGIAFQLIDDLIGIKGDSKQTGKSVGNDVREGKKTFPILLSIKTVEPIKREKILKVFGNKFCNNLDVEEAVKIISSLQIEETVRTEAMKYVQKAVDSVSNYEESHSKKMLLDILFFIVNRSK
ncbi:MAG: polyprenyl synthetase family protein [Nitrososphaeraceae archaeon]|nr:polyprenyl synthetase family protein [Nitrososphaeraceae archaeon]